jgi:DNA-nicking Smr family endonuclease
MILMSTRKKPSAEDVELFRRSVGPVRQVRHDKTGVAAKPSPPPRHIRQDSDARNRTDAFSDGFDAGEVTPEENLFFSRGGVQQRQLQRLRRGQLPIGAELDMHGMTTATARDSLIGFIAHCRDRRIRAIRVIHGKGYGSMTNTPVLKNRLNSWLRQHHDVLAFCSAPARHGGTGALYVLLRTSR